MNAAADPSRASRWLWLRVLLSGVVLFVLLERVYAATGDLNYLPSILLVGAATIPLSFCMLLYSRARMPEVSVVTSGLCVIWGGVLGAVLAGMLEYGTYIHLGTIPLLAIGVIEELAKLVVPAFFLMRGRRFYHTEFDGIMLGVAAGAGFAALESMGYGLVAVLLSGGNITTTVQTLIFRGLVAPGAHLAWTGLLAGALWGVIHPRASAHPFRRFSVTFIGVVILHVLWDGLATPWGYIVLSVLSLLWLWARIRRTEQRVMAQEPYSPDPGEVWSERPPPSHIAL